MNDESHLSVSEQSLVYRLRKRAEIRRNIADRKSVQENKPDRIADLLEEAANEIERLTNERNPSHPARGSGRSNPCHLKDPPIWH
jgi:hypothetical protein